MKRSSIYRPAVSRQSVGALRIMCVFASVVKKALWCEFKNDSLQSVGLCDL